MIRTQFSEVLEMPAPRALIHGRVELETHHVEPARKPRPKSSVVVAFQASGEAIGQSEIEQRLWSEVQPIVGEPVCSCDVDGRVAKRLRERPHGMDAGGCPLAQDIEVLRRGSRHEPAQDEVPAADQDDFVVEPPRR